MGYESRATHRSAPARRGAGAAAGLALLIAALAAGCGGGEDTAAPEAAQATPRAEAQALPDAALGKASQTPGVSVRGLIPVGVRRINWTTYEFDYRVVLQNSGPALDGVTARLVEPVRGVQVVDGTVAAGTLPADSLTVPNDKITVRKGLPLTVPVISLGAGSTADGVHIIGSDLFHLYEKHVPRHSKIYHDLVPILEQVYKDYSREVKERVYPGPEHTVFMKEDELKKFKDKVGWKK